MDKVSIITNIRKVIFENFNDIDLRFNNDQIFEILKQNEMVDPSVTIDKMEVYFKELCDAEILRNIAQNFTTQWFSCLNQLRKFNVAHVKKKVTSHNLRIEHAKILVVVLHFRSYLLMC